MRTLLKASLAVAAVCLFTASGWAAPATGVPTQKATPQVQLAQYGGGGGGYEHHHHYCRPHWHWACRYGECRCYHDED